MSDEKKFIAYCGLYCDECFFHKGTIADLARDLRKELRHAKFEKTAESLATTPFFPAFKDYNQCYEVLGAMVKLRCNKGCRDGGGNPYCKIRKCCQKMGYFGCWECSEVKTCNKLNTLKANHGIAHIKNLKKIKKAGIEEFLKGKKHWYVKE